jgi:hypothetical protein
MFRVRVTFSGVTGVPFLATHYLNSGGALTAANAVAGVGAFWTSLAGSMSSAHTWSTGTVVETVDPATGQPTGITAVTAVTGAGAQGGDQLPFATQGLMTWRTGQFLGGREIRGRTFIPGPTVAHTTNGVPTAAYKTALNAAAATYVAGVTFAPCVYSRKNATTALLTAASAWDTWAVLRSRRQ